MRSAAEPDPERFDPHRVAPVGCAKHARLYLVGEAPGEAEAAAGRPFVGPAGQALHKMMRAAGIDRAQVRLCNAIPYRPLAPGKAGAPRNRAPTRTEIDRFSACLLHDLERSEPRAILALGKSAMAAFGIRCPIEEARGRAFAHAGVPLFVTYRPQYVAYRGGEGGAVWRAMVHDLAQAGRAGSRQVQ
jgi:DNA polymerase